MYAGNSIATMWDKVITSEDVAVHGALQKGPTSSETDFRALGFDPAALLRVAMGHRTCPVGLRRAPMTLSGKSLAVTQDSL